MIKLEITSLHSITDNAGYQFSLLPITALYYQLTGSTLSLTGSQLTWTGGTPTSNTPTITRSPTSNSFSTTTSGIYAVNMRINFNTAGGSSGAACVTTNSPTSSCSSQFASSAQTTLIGLNQVSTASISNLIQSVVGTAFITGGTTFYSFADSITTTYAPALNIALIPCFFEYYQVLKVP